MKRALLACVPFLACATPASVEIAPAPVARADEPVVHDVAHSSGAVPSSVGGALRSWEIARIDALLACVQGKPCSPPPPPALDDATMRTLASAPARDAAGRRTAASAARAVIDTALAPDAFDRHARRRALSFVDEHARFAFDDVAVLLAEAKRDDRARILRAARPSLERSVDIAAEERAVLDATAARLGVTRAQLLSRRAGVDETSLRALVGGALASTGPLLAPVATDVTLLADVRAPPSSASDLKAARALALAARAAADPVLVEAAARAALAPRDAAGLADWSRGLAVDVRVAALSVLALLDGADADARDALASRILENDADVVRGAGALLAVDEGGLVIERFAALLTTPALARDLKGGARPEGWIRAWQEAPPLEEQGYPEAFIEVVKLLPELASE